MAAPAGETVAALLVRRIRELGVTHIHGVPGDYSFGVCDAIEADPQARERSACLALELLAVRG
jgi:indolepyruvate decarboxylase